MQAIKLIEKGRLGLRGKFIVVVAVSVIVVALALTFFTLYKADEVVQMQHENAKEIVSSAYKQVLDTMIRDREVERGQRLAADLMSPALFKDPQKQSEIENLAKKIESQKHVLYVVALDEKNKPFYAGRESAKDVPLDVVKAALESTAADGMRYGRQNDLFEVFLPVYEAPTLPDESAPEEKTPNQDTTEKKKLGLVRLGLELESDVAVMTGRATETASAVQLEGLRQKTGDDFDEIYRLSMILTLGMILIAIAVTSFLATRLTHPIRSLEKVVQEVQSNWNLTTRAPVLSRDEVGELGEGFNRMLASISEVVAMVRDASLHVGSASTELLAASEEISQGAKNQSRHLEDASSAVSEVSASIQQVAGNAQKAAEAARRGGQSASRVVENMNRIRQTVEETAQKIRELGESSKEIGKIVGVITQISDQTSLLALNAAIEAARAGEHGKGFAVVADEVSKLADRVSKSAKEIEELISTIKDKTEQSVVSMRAGTAEVEEGSTLVNETGRTFLDIVDLVQETATSVQEQAKASDEISNVMSEVLSISKETVSATDEAVAQGNELRELASKLEELVRKFKLEAK